MASETIRQQIVTNIDTRIKTILIPEIGEPVYKTDLGENVFWWRDMENNPFMASEVPGISLKDVLDNPEPYTMGHDLHRLMVEMDLATTTEVQMRQVIGDVEICVNTDLTWTNLAITTIIESDETVVEHKDQKYFGSKMLMEVQYKTAMGNPYNA